MTSSLASSAEMIIPLVFTGTAHKCTGSVCKHTMFSPKGWEGHHKKCCGPLVPVEYLEVMVSICSLLRAFPKLRQDTIRKIKPLKHNLDTAFELSKFSHKLGYARLSR